MPQLQKRLKARGEGSLATTHRAPGRLLTTAVLAEEGHVQALPWESDRGPEPELRIRYTSNARPLGAAFLEAHNAT
jgi:hypothetical protein